MAETLPEFTQDDRNLLLMGLAAGLDFEAACGVADTDRGTVEAWRQGDKDFAGRLEQAEKAAKQQEVAAAGAVRRAASEDAATAMKFLYERASIRELERVRELTTY